MTDAERKWVKKLQKVLNECPSERIGFYTTGDRSVTVYDRSKEEDINADLDSGRAGEFGCSVDLNDAYFEVLNFPAPVHSTAG